MIIVMAWMLTGCYGPDVGCADVDGDGYPAGDCTEGAETEPWYTDDDPEIHPGAEEVCDGVDNDVDGATDEDLIDTDGDGDPDCTDCAPLDATIGSGAPELGNDLDDDCDGEVDEGYPAEAWIESIQDLLRESKEQTFEVFCDLCGDDPTFVVRRDDEENPGEAVDVVGVEVAGSTAFATVLVDGAAQLGFYDVNWTIRESTGIIDEKVRISRGQVKIVNTSPDRLTLGEDARISFVVEGENFDWNEVVELQDAAGDLVTCIIDEVVPDRIDCHFDDTRWSLSRGIAIVSVRDEDDALDCGSYTSSCYDNGPVLVE